MFNRVKWFGLITVLLCSLVPVYADVVVIGNGVVGDGALTIALDDYGSWASAGFGGGGDTYDPAGALGPGEATFTAGMFVFVGNTHRELLSENAMWRCFGGSDPNICFNADTSLSTSVTQHNTASDVDGDGTNDTLQSAFDITGAGVSLHVDLTQAVRRTVNPHVSYLVQVYRITNTGGSSLTSKWFSIWDADLFWRTGGGNDWQNDQVGAGTFGGHRYVYQGEFGIPAAFFAMNTLTAPTCYFGAKEGHQPPNGPPPFGYGTDVQEWQAYGTPASWCNYVAFVGYNTDGNSGDQSSPPPAVNDAHLGLQNEVTLAPNETTEVIVVRTYGSATPATVERTVTVNLPNYDASNPCVGPVDVEYTICRSDGSSISGNFQIPAGQSSGSFTYPLNPNDETICIKASHWTSKKSNIPSGIAPYTVDAGANGDINGDDFVDPSDFALYQAAEFSFCGAGNYNPLADLNGDGFVDPSDFDIYVANEFAFGDGCGCP